MSDPISTPPAEAEATSKPPLDPRLRRVLEVTYRVEGVAAARIWRWDDKIALGVRAVTATAPSDLIQRVEVAVASLREPGEQWEFGLLEDT